MENKTCGGSMNVHAWKGYPTDLNDGKLHFKISLYLSGRTSRNKLLFLLTLPWCRYLQYHLTPGKCPLKWWNSLVIQLLPLLHEKLVSSSIRKIRSILPASASFADRWRCRVQSPDLVVANNLSTSAISIKASAISIKATAISIKATALETERSITSRLKVLQSITNVE